MLRRSARKAKTPLLRPAPEHDASCEPGQRSPNGFIDAPGPGRSAAESAWRWCRAARRKDLDAAKSLLATNVVLHTPMTDSFRFEGRAEVGSLLGILFSKLDYLDYHTDVGEGATRVVGFHGRSNGIEFEEYLVLSFDEQHRIRHAVVAVRGMSGLALIFSTIGPDLLRMHHSRWGAGLARFGLPIITRAVVAMERWLLPLAEPNRDRP